MKKLTLFNITFQNDDQDTVLEKIVKYLKSPNGFFHIVSLNPENIVISVHDREFKKVIDTAQIHLVDGVGVAVAGRLLLNTHLIRMTGADTLVSLINYVGKERLKALLIGGQANLALSIAKCQNQIYPKAKFIGLEGFQDIKNPTPAEEEAIFRIVREERPQIIFAAFGSPEQEKWFYRNRDRLNGLICMGVGGGFDYLGGKIFRAPAVFRRLGLEWLWRLVSQPWRFYRQLRLIEFVWLIIKAKMIRGRIGK